MPSPSKSQFHSVAPCAATSKVTVPAVKGSVVGVNCPLRGRVGSAPRLKGAVRSTLPAPLDRVSLAVYAPAAAPAVFHTCEVLVLFWLKTVPEVLSTAHAYCSVG